MDCVVIVKLNFGFPHSAGLVPSSTVDVLYHAHIEPNSFERLYIELTSRIKFFLSSHHLGEDGCKHLHTTCKAFHNPFQSRTH